MRRALTMACLAWAAGMTGAGAAEPLVRHPIPGSDFPIAQAIEIPAGRTTVLVSGQVPGIADPAAPRNTLAAYGDTRVQSVSVLKAIEATLKRIGLGMGDVVKMQVYLVGDPTKEGRMDFAGFMEAYRDYFGARAQQPNLPTRSVFQVAGLANPGWLVEIEVTAVRP